MDTATFLAHVVAPGQFIAVCFKSADKPMITRFFPRADINQAAGLIRWADGKSMDTWVGLASYQNASVQTTNKGETRYKGERTQANAEQLICFWCDTDVVRPGDGKNPRSVFATLQDAESWAKSLSLPPNLMVRSGYGLHLYWLLDAALPRDQWEPRAHQFKAYLIAHGARGDTGIITDAARILRPPETRNWKVSTDPKAVKTHYWSTQPYTIAMIDPYLAAYPATVTASRRTGTGNNLIVLNGAVATAFQSISGGAAAAVQANLPVGGRPHYMQQIAQRCEQVKQSLASGGAGDPYPLWYLGHLSLAAKCVDGPAAVHALSKGDSRYDFNNVDKHLAQVQDEQRRKSTGAPTCEKYNGYRPGVCTSCPFWQTALKSPYTLGLIDFDINNIDMPDKYKRQNGSINYFIGIRDSNEVWEPITKDIFLNPRVEEHANGYRLIITIGKHIEHIHEDDLASNNHRVALCRMHITAPSVRHLDKIRDFFMAWIDKLKDDQLDHKPILPFHWNDSKLALGHVVYSKGEPPKPIPISDHRIVGLYTPKGKLADWQRAAGAVIKDRPELQIMLAMAPASVLVPFSGQRSLAANFYTHRSGAGKTTGLDTMLSFWAQRNAAFGPGDTANGRFNRISLTHMMPIALDEVQVDPRDIRNTLTFDLFRLIQGRGKVMLNRNSVERDTGEWTAMMVACSNYNLFELIMRGVKETNAATARLFPIEVVSKYAVFDLTIEPALIANYGVAGAVYAQFLVDNYDEKSLTDLIHERVERVFKHFKIAEDERFFATFIGLVWLGAELTQQAGIITFDLKSMFNTMVNSLMYVRRHTKTMSELDCLLAILKACEENTLVVDEMPSPTHNRVEPKVISMSKFLKKVDIQISVTKRPTLRICKETMEKWLVDNSTYRVRDFYKSFNAKIVERASLGKGNGAPGTPTNCVDFDLNTPGLEIIKDNYCKLPPPQLKGMP